MRRIYTILLIVFLSSFSAKAQKDEFSQYMLSSLYLNPAYASAYSDLSINLNYKSRQVASSVTETAQVSAVFPIKLDNVSDNVAGIGIMAFNQKVEGGLLPYNDNGLYLTYSQNFSLGLLGSDLIAIGIQGGYSKASVSAVDLDWGSYYNRYSTSGVSYSNPVTEFDNFANKLVINAGVMYYYNRKRNYLLHNYSAYSGISISNLNRPNDSFNQDKDARESMRFKYHGGIELRINNLYLLPNALVEYSRGDEISANAGMHLAYSFESTARFTSSNKGFQLLLGSWYRLREAFVFLGGVQFNSLAIRGSYDMNTNLFVSAGVKDFQVAPAYEISILYTLSSDPTLRKMNNALF